MGGRRHPILDGVAPRRAPGRGALPRRRGVRPRAPRAHDAVRASAAPRRPSTARRARGRRGAPRSGFVVAGVWAAGSYRLMDAPTIGGWDSIVGAYARGDAVFGEFILLLAALTLPLLPVSLVLLQITFELSVMVLAVVKGQQKSLDRHKPLTKVRKDDAELASVRDAFLAKLVPPGGRSLAVIGIESPRDGAALFANAWDALATRPAPRRLCLQRRARRPLLFARAPTGRRRGAARAAALLSLGRLAGRPPGAARAEAQPAARARPAAAAALAHVSTSSSARSSSTPSRRWPPTRRHSTPRRRRWRRRSRRRRATPRASGGGRGRTSTCTAALAAPRVRGAPRRGARGGARRRRHRRCRRRRLGAAGDAAAGRRRRARRRRRPEGR